MSSERALAREVFEKLRSRFSNLRCVVDESPEHVDLLVEFPAQPDLLFDVSLNLQNGDELHLNASLLWVSWFPCSDPAVRDSFVDAVTGLVAGEYRILEHRRGSRTVRAELQKPAKAAAGWETITGSSYLSIPWPRKTIEIVQNPRIEPRRAR